MAQVAMRQELNARAAAHDFQGVVDMTVEASRMALASRTTHPACSASIYVVLGLAHKNLALKKLDQYQKIHQYQDAIVLLTTAIAIFEEIREDELAA